VSPNTLRTHRKAGKLLAPAALPPPCHCGTACAGAAGREAGSSGGAGGLTQPPPSMEGLPTPKHRGASDPQGRPWGARTRPMAAHRSQV